jgi:hypothetical protein
MTTEELTKIANYANGQWTYKKENIEHKVYISDLGCTYQILEDGIQIEKIDFSRKAAWFGDLLLFTDKMKYFVSFANDERLIFGEAKGVLKGGEILWKYEFERVTKDIAF